MGPSRTRLARIAGPLASSAKSPVEWTAWGTAILAAIYIAWCFPNPLGCLAALGLPLLVLRFPVAGILGIGVVAQEVSPNGHHGFLNTFAHDVYITPGKIPIILPLAIAAALAVIARRRPNAIFQMRVADVSLFGSVLALILLTIGVGLFGGQSAFSALNQNARPFIILLLGLIIGASLGQFRTESKYLPTVIGVALTGLVVAAAIAVPFGDTANEHVSRYFIYYDWALPAIATAVLIALLGAPSWIWDWRHVAVAVGTPLLILISFRRAVWVAAVIVLFAAAVLGWRRWRQVLSRLAFAGLAAAVIVIAAPGFAPDLALRSGVSAESGDSSDAKPKFVEPSRSSPSGASPSASPPSSTPSDKPSASEPQQKPSQKSTTSPQQAERAQRQDDSTSGHIDDLRLGWKYVQENFWTGVGPKSPQLPGLAAKDTARVYVHNELLQVWLRYGLAAPLLLAFFFLSAGITALRSLSNQRSDVIVRAAAAFCLVAPIVLMTGAFLTDTSRWPLLFGIAAGVLARRRPSQPTSANGVGTIQP